MDVLIDPETGVWGRIFWESDDGGGIPQDPMPPPPHEGNLPDRVPRNGMNPGQILPHGMYPDQIPPNGMHPDQIPPNGMHPDQIPPNGMNPDRVAPPYGMMNPEQMPPPRMNQDQGAHQMNAVDAAHPPHRLHHQHRQHQAAATKPLVIYFHGGSFAHSSANSAIYDAMCRRLARMCGVVILSVNFRRAPENRYPCAYEDGYRSVEWAQGMQGRIRLSRLGCDPLGKCFLAGDSSGGNIAHHVAVRAAQSGSSLAGTILLMPMFGGQGRTPSEMALDGKYFVTVKDRDWYWRAFLPLGANRDHPASNPFSMNAPRLQNIPLPPCLVIMGGYDLLQDWQLSYVHGLRQAGKSVQVMFLEQATIGFFLLPNSDLFYHLVEMLRKFFGKHS
jgi:gibberellin receptor GID1